MIREEWSELEKGEALKWSDLEDRAGEEVRNLRGEGRT
jgi:hypothetical protein